MARRLVAGSLGGWHVIDCGDHYRLVVPSTGAIQNRIVGVYAKREDAVAALDERKRGRDGHG